jgi:acetylornithine deacetylase/succinyl-diaminopimelate desuccinylase family protein
LLNQILATIEEEQDQLLAFAAEMIRFQTPDPPAHNTKEIQEWLAARMREIGMKTISYDLYPEEPLLVGTSEPFGAQRTLTFNGHIDVAQVNSDECWDIPPFEPRLSGGYLYGRGATDMKAGLAAAFWAIKTVLQAGVPLRHNIMLQTVGGEEAGEHGSKMLLEKGHRGDFAIIPEPTELRVCGQGGVVTMWVTIKSQKTFHDGMRARMIHAGGGVDGASAIEKMVKIIAGMQELERAWAVTKSYPGMPFGSNTINPSVIKGGRHPAFIADECALWYTIHFLPNEPLEAVKTEVLDHLHRIAEADPWLRHNPPEVIFGGSSMFRDRGEIFPASGVDLQNPYVELLLRTFDQTLKRKAEVVIFPSVCDSGWFAEAGVPVVICGPGSLEEAHAVNEKVAVQQVVEAAKLYAAYVLAFCAEGCP